MATYFDRPVISSTATGEGADATYTAAADPVSGYVAFCLAHGDATSEFGRLLAPLGVRYVVVAKDADWQDESWLLDQRDLKVVRSWSDLVLLENTESVAPAYAPTRTVKVATYGGVLALSLRAPLTAYRIEVARPVDGPVVLPSGALPVPPVVPAAVHAAPRHLGLVHRRRPLGHRRALGAVRADVVRPGRAGDRGARRARLARRAPTRLDGDGVVRPLGRGPPCRPRRRGRRRRHGRGARRRGAAPSTPP